MTAIKTIVRALTESQIDFDREVIALHKIESGVNWDISEEWTQVMSVYTDGKGGSIHYRLDGIKNNYFRKAEKCNDLTYSKSDRVYAKLGDIHYDIPTGGVPVIKDKLLAEVLAKSPSELIVGAFVLENAAGEFHYTHGEFDEADTFYVSEVGRCLVGPTKWVSDSVVWVRLDNEDAYYIIRPGSIAEELQRTMLKATKNRWAVRISVTGIRGYPRLIRGADISQKFPELQELMDTAELVHPVEYRAMPTEGNHASHELTSSQRDGITREIVDVVEDGSGDVYLILRDQADREGPSCIKVHKTDEMDLNQILYMLAVVPDRILKRFYITYTEYPPVTESSPMPSIPPERESVVWKATAVNGPTTPYFVSLVLTHGNVENVLARCRDYVALIPGLIWCDVIEIYEDGSVLVHNHGVVQCTPAARAELRRQITTTHLVTGVRVGIVTMSVNRN